MARLQQKTQAAGTTGSAQDIPTFPARWLCSLYAIFPGTGCLAPVASEFVLADLASAPGCQNHATSPSHRIVRRHDHHAATQRAHRIPHPTSVTTAKRPLSGTGWRIKARFLINGNRKIFAERAGQGESR